MACVVVAARFFGAVAAVVGCTQSHYVKDIVSQGFDAARGDSLCVIP